MGGDKSLTAFLYRNEFRRGRDSVHTALRAQIKCTAVRGKSSIIGGKRNLRTGLEREGKEGEQSGISAEQNETAARYHVVLFSATCLEFFFFCDAPR